MCKYIVLHHPVGPAPRSSHTHEVHSHARPRPLSSPLFTLCPSPNACLRPAHQQCTKVTRRTRNRAHRPTPNPTADDGVWGGGVTWGVGQWGGMERGERGAGGRFFVFFSFFFRFLFFRTSCRCVSGTIAFQSTSAWTTHPAPRTRSEPAAQVPAPPERARRSGTGTAGASPPVRHRRHWSVGRERVDVPRHDVVPARVRVLLPEPPLGHCPPPLLHHTRLRGC